jgi:ABC-2 type transport system ATP-binding protein
MHALTFDRVTKRYGHKTVVSDLSFTVEPGRVTGFLGPNGAGKSTTMKVLLDLATADSGSATIGGSLYRDLKDPSRVVGVILEHAYHPARSGRNHLRILADASGVPLSRVDEMLELVGLADAADRHAGAYSLGMRQRLGLAAALLRDPPVLVLDEPGNGLDPQGIRDLRDLLRARAATGGTVFVSSHLLSEVEHLADELVVMNQGRLVTSGALADLQQSAASVRTPTPEPLVRLLEQAGGSVRVREDGALVVRGLEIAEIGDRACAAGIALHELAGQAGSLEDLFLDWTRADVAPSVPAQTRRRNREDVSR